jgi:hypothetical protein
MKSERKTHFMRILAFLGPICLIAAGCSVILISNDKSPKAPKINLEVYYGFPARNQFNSADKFYKKETLPSHFAQTTIELDNNQKNLILKEANSLHFFQMPDSFYHKEEVAGSKFQWLRITLDSTDKTINWHGSIDNLQPKNFNIKELVLFVDSIVKSTDAYQALPKSQISGD